MALAQLNLQDLDGSNGFIIPGINENDNLGRSVSSAGDINGDGIDDLIIGAPYAGELISGYYGNYYYSDRRGEAYVVFGTTDGFDAEIDLTSLDGSNGFTISGLDRNDNLGRSVSNAGDVNGDGIDDLIIGSPNADAGNYYSDYSDKGEAYVVFGTTDGFDGELDLTSLDGSNGFTISGIDSNDRLGSSVSSAGDINGDGIDDLIISAPNAGEPTIGDYGNYYYSDRRGEAYVVFGTTEGFDANLDLTSLDGRNGFTISGINSFDNLGSSVSSAGDINGDGIDDLIIGAPNTGAGYYNSYSSEGTFYVVFGTTEGFDAELDLTSLDGSNGFTIPGIDRNDRLGRSVSSAGDINGDGIDDLIIGTPSADTGYNSYSSEGEAYVVFGTSDGFDAELDLTSLDGSNGFTISGIDQNDNLGQSVSNAGDFNGDGFDDLLISAPNAGSTNSYYSGGGEVYILFGSSNGFDADIDLNELDSDDGFIISGIDQGDDLGRSLSSAGDLNGDGFDDLIIGAPGADTTSPYSGEGETYVIFGFAPVDLTGTANDDVLTGSPVADFLSGLAGNDTLKGLGGDDQIRGGSGDDSILAGEGDDIVQGGTGADLISGEGGSDILVGDRGNDLISGGAGDDDISGGNDNDSLLGNGGDDTINGDDGFDTIKGGAGNDLIRGGSNSDRLFGQAGNDTVSGNSGIDTIRGGAGDDLLNGGSDRDRLFGQAGNDTLNGESDSDYLVGGKGNDLIDGGEGNDTVIGVEIQGSNLTFGAGNFDTLTGGEGADTFVLGDADNIYYDDGDSFTAGESDFAIITDFDQNQDTIQLNGSAELYSLDFFTSVSGSIDAKLIYDPGIAAAGELIAVLENVSADLTVDEPEFTFI